VPYSVLYIIEYIFFSFFFFGFLYTFQAHCLNNILSQHSLFSVFCSFFCILYSQYLYVIFTLSAVHLCLGLPLQRLFVFGFHAVICPISLSDFHTHVQPILVLFKVPPIYSYIALPDFRCFVFHILFHSSSLVLKVSLISFSQILLTHFLYYILYIMHYKICINITRVYIAM